MRLWHPRRGQVVFVTPSSNFYAGWMTQSAGCAAAWQLAWLLAAAK